MACEVLMSSQISCNMRNLDNSLAEQCPCISVGAPNSGFTHVHGQVQAFSEAQEGSPQDIKLLVRAKQNAPIINESLKCRSTSTC